MALVRLWHSYIGIIIGPSVIFFALTGAWQLFSLDEAHGTYTPPALVEKLSSMHKDQVFEQKRAEDREPESAAKPDQPPQHEHEEGPNTGTVLLKWFFLFVSVALAVSTVLGLWIGLTHVQQRRKRLGWWLLLGGLVLPVALFAL